MSKHIVFCADGTWSNAEQSQPGDDVTNVYKLFLSLRGDVAPGPSCRNEEQEKFDHQGGRLRLVAKYLHGVGDSRQRLRRLLGGAFGAGTLSRIVRGYTFISRHYEPGDAIVISGFSRGAYTARALAALIASQGLLAPAIGARGKAHAYRMAALAWQRHRASMRVSAEQASRLQRLAGWLRALPGLGAPAALVPETDLIAVPRIECVAVWDTVGALGLPLPSAGAGARADLLRFGDTRLSPKVRHGYHAISLDEQRADFVPCLWDAAGNVTQVLFPGAHADVGGGYPVRDYESGLSDVALDWMLNRLSTHGVGIERHRLLLAPDAVRGVQHEPWVDSPWARRPRRRRDFAGVPHLHYHHAIRNRMSAPEVPRGRTHACYRPFDYPVERFVDESHWGGH